MRILDVLVKLYLALVVVDLLVGWVQTDPRRIPRRITHVLTEPPQTLLRLAVPARWTWGWDLSPLLLLASIGLARVLWIHPW